MSRRLNSLLIGSMLALLFVGSAASVPDHKGERAWLLSPAPKTAVGKSNIHPLKSAQADSERSFHEYGAPFAQVDWLTFSDGIPAGFGTVLAGGCVLLPFALSTLGTLRKRR